MGMNNEHSGALIFDVETVAIDGAAEFLEPVSAPSNWKDQAKIDAYVAEKTVERAEKAALDVDLARIVAIGWMLEGRDTEPRVLTCENDDRERFALREFWRELELPGNATRRTVTFNGLRYDCPLVMRRSLYLGIPHRWLNVDKYRSPHIDLCDRLSFHGAITAHGLKFYAKRFGLSEQEPDIHGSQIAALINEGAWDAVRAHCASDVLLTHDLAERLHYIHFDEDAYDEAQREIA